MALSDGDFGGAFSGGSFGDLLSPSFGYLLATDPEKAIPLLVQAGVDPNDFMKMASLGTGTATDAGGGAPPLESGYPPPEGYPPTAPMTPTEAVPRSESMPTAADSLEQFPNTTPGMPAQGTPPAAPPPPPPVQEATNPWDLMKQNFLREQMAGRTDFPYETAGADTPQTRTPFEANYSDTPAGSREPFEAGYPEASNAPGFWDRLFGGVNKDPSAAAGAPAPTTPAAAAAEAPPAMPGGGTGFNTFGTLGGLYPLATPPTSASDTVGGQGGPGIPLPLSDPRRTGIESPTGASGNISKDKLVALSKALSGVKAPTQPTPPALHPYVPRGGDAPKAGGDLISLLLQRMSGGQAAAAGPLRLGQTVGR